MGECFITRRGVINNLQTKFPEFSYSGNYTLIDDGYDEENKIQNWRIKFLTSGVFKPTKIVDSIDVFLVGGGAGGNEWWSAQRSSGGGSGYTKSSFGLSTKANDSYEIIVGAGGANCGAGGVSSVTCNDWSVSVNGGNSWNGGSGGAAWGGNNNPGSDGSNSVSGGTGQGSTTREFGATSGTLYAGGGGAFGSASGRWGGAGGGGNGGWKTTNATNGGTNTGGGGGGSDYGYEASDLGPAGRGGSGIVIIRNHRTI